MRCCSPLPCDHDIDRTRAEKNKDPFCRVCCEEKPITRVEPGLTAESGWKPEVAGGRDPQLGITEATNDNDVAFELVPEPHTGVPAKGWK
jgi:hypothetical protein